MKPRLLNWTLNRTTMGKYHLEVRYEIHILNGDIDYWAKPITENTFRTLGEALVYIEQLDATAKQGDTE